MPLILNDALRPVKTSGEVVVSREGCIVVDTADETDFEEGDTDINDSDDSRLGQPHPHVSGLDTCESTTEEEE